MDADLNKLAGAATVSQQAQMLVPLEKYVAANLPVTPLETAAESFEETRSTPSVGRPSQTPMGRGSRRARATALAPAPIWLSSCT